MVVFSEQVTMKLGRRSKVEMVRAHSKVRLIQVMSGAKYRHQLRQTNGRSVFEESLNLIHRPYLMIQS
jgi:hypothetical protein